MQEPSKFLTHRCLDDDAGEVAFVKHLTALGKLRGKNWQIPSWSWPYFFFFFFDPFFCLVVRYEHIDMAGFSLC